MEVMRMTAHRGRARTLARQIKKRAVNEAALFATYLEVEEHPGLTDEQRSRLLADVINRVDELRAARGLAPDAGLQEILATYDGAPPAPGAEFEAKYPGSRASEGYYVEHVGGRTRVFPILTVDVPGMGIFTLQPERARNEPRFT